MSNTLTKYWAVIPAAGIGRRMESAIPKQYLPLLNSTVLDITLKKLLEHPLISGIAVAISPDDRWWSASEYAIHKDVIVVIGGDERCDSVLNALIALQDIASKSDGVLVHDAARPCVRSSDITSLIEAAGNSHDGGLLGVPVKDTMKHVNKKLLVTKTLDRSSMWHAFTPQLFPLGILIKALKDAYSKGEKVTDDASAMELAGYHPLLVEGSQDNIKITRPEDLALATYYLKEQEAI